MRDGDRFDYWGCAVTRFLMSIGNLIFAFFLGAVVLAFVFIQFPNLFESILNSAGSVKTAIVNHFPVSDEGKHYKNLVRYIIEEAQLVFMFFVIVARIILSLGILLVQSIMPSSN